MDIQFDSEFTVTDREKTAYIEAVKEHVASEGQDARLLSEVKLELVKGDPEKCNVSYKLKGHPFERIRRINIMVPSLR